MSNMTWDTGNIPYCWISVLTEYSVKGFTAEITEKGETEPCISNFQVIKRADTTQQEARLISSRERADILVHLQVFALWFLQWTCRILLPLWELLADGTALE